MQLAQFIAELKRRRVFRVLVGYGIVAFAVLQIVEPILHAMRLPESALSYVVLALGLGFPVAVVLAWAFDVNEGRLERTPPTGVPHRTPLLALVLMGIGFLAAAPGITYYFFLRKPQVGASIAVLPFVNMSASAEDEYFSDGLSEELINALAGVPGLRVTSRTSAFAFKGKQLLAQQIGSDLNVAAVVEGSVRREGNSLRITAQLIDTSSGYHLWSASYDRELKSIFAVEEELARSIMHALKSRLVPDPATPVVRPTTSNLAAHDLYLKGRYFWNKRSAESLKTAAAYFQQAIDLDPAYAVAYAGLADSTVMLHEYGSAMLAEVAPKARQAAHKALALDATLAEAEDTLGMIDGFEFNWAAAERHFHRAIALNPRYPTAHHRYSLLLLSIGRTREAVAEAEKARQLDPTSLIINNILTASLYMSREYERALEQALKTLELDPGFPLAHAFFARAKMAQGGGFRGGGASREGRRGEVPEPVCRGSRLRLRQVRPPDGGAAPPRRARRARPT